MKKSFALFACVCLAVELALIEFAFPLYGQIIICAAFVVFLFYFALTSEGLIDNDTSHREPVYVQQHHKVKVKGKKHQKISYVTRKKVEPRQEEPVTAKKTKGEDEEEESEFQKEWKRMEREADKRL